MSADVGVAVRRGPLVAEIAALVVFVVFDVVVLLTSKVPPATGLLGAVYTALTPSIGPMAAVLAVLRRRFGGRIGLLGGCVAGLSLFSTAISALASATHTPLRTFPGATETFALALLLGAGCRRLPWRPASALAVASGLAMTSAQLLRYGTGSPAALFAVPAALLWGGALAVGLVLRDTDSRRSAELAEVRAGERLRLARELHDLVAHSVTGIVVRAQAARVTAVNPLVQERDPVEVYGEIEEAGAEALSAMRRLVGMLRTADDTAETVEPGGIADAVRRAVSGNERVRLDLPDGLETAPATPELSTTVHRVVLEALTNVRRHAPTATEVAVTLRVQLEPDFDQLVLEILNDGAESAPSDRSRRGYGLVGMTERVTALGGTLRAGGEPGRRWRISVRLPLGDPAANHHLPEGPR
ncbi:MAG: two-component system histidine kinase [Amycolatopsis sp.]|jgi:signal transduction histidine kinase|uniref:sensor histidine kinase n=1 Tax=Amycolatopsis sp. TaxID=37632 RepID=UPI0026361E5A|nr:histidine kinase [Amycolatopsis sp.]MCU1684674.1 two-component system histidine kinase [Amycolatopsis sp.]